MSWQLASLLLLGGSTVLLFIGLPVAFAFMAINIVGAILFLGGDAGLSQMLRNSAAAVKTCHARAANFIDSRSQRLCCAAFGSNVGSWRRW